MRFPGIRLVEQTEQQFRRIREWSEEKQKILKAPTEKQQSVFNMRRDAELENSRSI